MTLRTLVVALASLAAVLPTAAFAQCHYAVNPKVTIALDGPEDLLTHKPKLVSHWEVNSTGECASNWRNAADADILFVANNEFLFDGSSDEIDHNQTGQTVIDRDVWGSKVKAQFGGWCGDPMMNSGITTVQGNTLVIPPWVDTADRLHASANVTRIADESGYFGELTAIPVGKYWHVAGLMSAHPRGTEKAIFHVQGAGIDWSKGYTGDKDHPAGDTYQQDPEADQVAKTPGQVKFWIEFEGTKSDERVFTVVAGDGSGSNNSNNNPDPGSTTNPGSTSGDPSNSDDSKSGCSVVGGASGSTFGLFALLGLALRRRRA